MVLKQGKGAVNTGGTVRKVSAKHQSRYNKQGTITKVFNVPASGISQLPRDVHTGYIFEDHRKALDDGCLTGTGIEYSLNKRSRWKLAGLVKGAVSNTSSSQGLETPEDYDITLLEHHKLNRQATCLGCHSTRLRERSATPKKSTYFDERSVLNPGKTVSNKQKRRQRQRHQGTEVETEAELTARKPEVCYTLLYPAPSTSAVSHIANQTMDDDILFPEDVEHRTLFKRKGSKRNRMGKNGTRHVIMDDYWGEGDGLDDNDKDCFEDTWRWAYDDSDSPRPNSRHSLSLDSFIVETQTSSEVTAIVTKKKKKKKKHTSRSVPEEQSKSHIVLDVRSNRKTRKAKSDIVIPVSKPVEVQVETTQLSEEILTGQFGMMYSEVNCWPRRFAVDISDEVRDHILHASCKPATLLGRADATAFLACWVHPTDGSTEFNTISVWLESDLVGVKTLELNTLSQTVYNMQEVVQASCSYVSSLPKTCYPRPTEKRRHKSGQLAKIENKPDVVHQALGCQLQAMTPEVAYKELGVMQLQPASQQDIVMNSTWIQVCGICNEECTLINDNATSNDVPLATALLPCQHWFCNACWVTYFKTQMSVTMSVITCPEYNCKSVVSQTMLLMFLGLEAYQRYAQTQLRLTLSVKTGLFWCPNPLCDRVVLPAGCGMALIQQRIACPCGKLWCANCQGESHWPATCKQAQLYMEMLKKNGDVDIKSTSAIRDVKVMVKRCPHCKQLVHKVSGCPYMTCVCSKNFCWDCLQPWGLFHDCSARANASARAGLRRVWIQHEDTHLRKSKSRSYRRSVEHRKGHHPSMVTTLKHQAAALAKLLKIKTLNAQHDLDHDIKLKLMVKRAGRDDTTKFFMSAVELILQLHQVCEYTVISLHSRHGGPLINCLDRMEQAVFQLRYILECGAGQDLKNVFGKVCHLLHMGQQAVGELGSYYPHCNPKH